MARNYIEKKIKEEIVTCDRCGKKLTKEDVNDFWLVAHGIGSWNKKEAVVFEASKSGDYCNSCLLKLQGKILEVIGNILNDRYDTKEETRPDQRVWELIEKEQ